MSIRIVSRDFSKTVVLNAVRLGAERMTWNMLGGPDLATVRATAAPGQRPALMQLTQLLRCGVEIAGENGLAWWGFINQVEIHTHGIVYVTSLDELANSVAVRFRDESPAPGEIVSWQFQTEWAIDTYSQSQYGVKEQVFNLGEARSTEALALRDLKLGESKLPKTSCLPSGVGSESEYAVLRCLGWWHTLGWRFFSEARGYEGNLVGSTMQLIGDSAGNTVAGQKIRLLSATGWNLREVWFKLKVVGAPGDSIQFKLYGDTAGSPAPGILTSKSVLGSILTGDYTWCKFSLAAAYSLAAATDYWLTAQRTGALDGANYYVVAVDEQCNYTRGEVKIYNGAAWGARVPAADMVFTALGEEESTTQITAMAAAAGAGQFLTGVFVKDASGLQAHLWRAGKRRALDEIKDLLGMGTSAAVRLVADVTPARVLVVRKALDAGGIDLVIDSNGIIRYKDGRKLGAADQPAGRWARVAGLPPAAGDYGPGLPVLIERAVWQDGILRVFWE